MDLLTGICRNLEENRSGLPVYLLTEWARISRYTRPAPMLKPQSRSHNVLPIPRPSGGAFLRAQWGVAFGERDQLVETQGRGGIIGACGCCRSDNPGQNEPILGGLQ